MNTEIRECPIHGLTEFHFYEKKNRKGLWKCLKCDTEHSIISKFKYKIKAILYKGGKCEVCGYNKNISALEFHHLDPSLKDFGISETKRSWEDTKKELDKCILVCSNCHRELHNPGSTLDSLNSLILKHLSNLEIKLNKRALRKFKYTLSELNLKRKELKSWKKVADHYHISISTLKRHLKILK